jgi:hypothetical protein
MAEQKAPKAQKPELVKVISKFDLFVDLVMNKNITKTPSIVEMHPWLQDNIDRGLVLVVEE